MFTFVKMTPSSKCSAEGFIADVSKYVRGDDTVGGEVIYKTVFSH